MTGQLKIRIQERVRNYTVLQNLPTISGSHPTSYSVTTGILSPRPQRSERKADHSPPPCDKIKNKWSYTSTPLHTASWRSRDGFSLLYSVEHQFRNYILQNFNINNKYLFLYPVVIRIIANLITITRN